jgi:hypothetical protein
MVGKSATISISGFVARKLVNSYTHAFHAREGITTSRPVRATKVISTIRKITGRQSPDINDSER